MTRRDASHQQAPWYDACDECRLRVYAPCDAHKDRASEWFDTVRREVHEWQERRATEFNQRWEVHAAKEFPPDWSEVAPQGDWENAYGPRAIGLLPRITPEKAVELMRSSRVYGQPVLAPEAPYAKRGEVEALASAEAFARVDERGRLPTRMYGSRLERLEAETAREEAREWAAREAFRIAPYAPGVAAATLEVIGDVQRACDCWLLSGDIEGAVRSLDGATPDLAPLEQRVNLHRILGWEINPADLKRIVSLGSKLTAFGREHQTEILDFVAANAATFLDVSDGLVVERLFQSPTLPWRPWLLFGGDNRQGDVDRFLMAGVWSDETIRKLGGDLGRVAEDLFREAEGMPRVGEGWISETALFRAIESALSSETTVVHHGRPEGFGLQHLDVWLPEWRVGVEFQGRQHDEPIDFFGGQEAYEATRRRDAEKKRKAKRLGIRLIEVRPGYELGAVIADIRSAAPASGSS